MDNYNVKTQVFEGPLDTLLSLIEKRKLFINDISLAQVADDYIAYVKSLEKFLPAGRHVPIADSAHFILIASTLVLIKSKSLLPNLDLSPEEQSSIEDLEARLAEYQKYKNLSNNIGQRFGKQMMYAKLPSKEKKIVFAPDKNTNVSKIREIISVVINALPKMEQVPKAIVQKVISLEEMIEDLTERIQKSIKMSFKEFSGKGDKVNLIVSFLAMLELVKQGIIEVRQDKDFHDIEMETQIIGVPKY